jgi:AcrR family transcriptional regulator
VTSLILEKGYEHVTVQDICDRADVGRPTFYEHLRDKEELLLSGFDDLYDELRQAFADHEQQTASRNAKPGSWAVLVVIEQIANYRAVSSMLCSRASTVASARLRRILSSCCTITYVSSSTDRKHPGPHRFRDRGCCRLVAGVDPPVARARSSVLARTLEEMYRRLTEPGIREALRPA